MRIVETDSAIADRLARRIVALAEAPMRRAVVKSELARLSMHEQIIVLIALERGAAARSDPHLLALRAFAELCTLGGISEQWRADLRHRAERFGALEVLQILLRPNAARVAPPPEAAAAPQMGGGKDLLSRTLGERKSAARGSNRRVLDRLVADPSPHVAEVLLANPYLTERDVVRMAARRPVEAGVLQAIHRHPRWSLRVMVRRALVRNPYTPPAIALSLLPLLGDAVAREVANDDALSPAVQDAARLQAGLMPRQPPVIDPIHGDDPGDEELAELAREAAALLETAQLVPILDEQERQLPPPDDRIPRRRR